MKIFMDGIRACSAEQCHSGLGSVKAKLIHNDRVREDRDVNAVRNTILLSERNPPGTQGIDASGEDAGHWQDIAAQLRRIRKPPLL